MKERIHYFDTFRFLAAMMIFMTHYINHFSPDSFEYFHVMPYSIVLRAVAGKLGVAILCVIMGYFAYKKGAKSNQSLVSLTAKRYIYFVVMCVVYYIIAGAVRFLEIDGSFPHIIKELFWASIKLTDTYNTLFWTMVPMLMGSVLCYILGRARGKTESVLLFLGVLYLIEQPWLFASVMGCLLAVWQEEELVKKVMSRPWVQIPIFLISFCSIRGSESYHRYILYAVFGVVIVLIAMFSEPAARFLNAKFWCRINKSYFSIYIFHCMLYNTVGEFLLNCAQMQVIPFKIRFILVFLILTAIIVLLSYPLEMAVNWICKYGYKVVDLLDEKVSGKSQS